MTGRCAFGWVLLAVVIGSGPVSAAGPAGAGAVMNLLKSGKVPPERLGPVLEIVCTRGNAQELAFVLERVLAPDAFPAAVRVDVLRKLAEAATTRKVIPEGELGSVAMLLSADDTDLRLAAIELCGLWNVPSAVEPLSALVTDSEAGAATRVAALNSVLQIDPAAARRVIDTMTETSRPFAVQSQGVAALARIDLALAAKRAAATLSRAAAGDDPSPIVDAFLERQGGADALAAALTPDALTEDVAKLALRRMYAIGRSDAALSSVLEQAAKIAGDVRPPVGDELAALMAEVSTHGDPSRGEAVFRRADLSCVKCHAVSQAGGQIGPDLSAVGSTSPVDYLINAVYDPDAQIKEAYVSKVVLTADGLTFQGIVADRTRDTLVLKDADGKRHEIPLADIDEEIEGKSLMPKGLVKFMTRDEIVDLVAFLSQLGRPGQYAVRSTPRMQRWRVLVGAAEGLVSEVPNDELFADRVLTGGQWAPLYARVDGTLPVDEAVRLSGSPVVYVRGEFEVQTAGPVGVRIDSPAPYALWIDVDSINAADEIVTDATTGRHSITLRIDTAGHESGDIRLELFRPADSPAVFATVDGQ